MKLLKIPLDFPIAQFLVRLSRSPVALVWLSTSMCPHRAAGPGAGALPGGDCVKAEITVPPPVPRGAPWGRSGEASLAAWRLTGSPGKGIPPPAPRSTPSSASPENIRPRAVGTLPSFPAGRQNYSPGTAFFFFNFLKPDQRWDPAGRSSKISAMRSLGFTRGTRSWGRHCP